MKKYLYLNEKFAKHPTYSFSRVPEGIINAYMEYYRINDDCDDAWCRNGINFTWNQLVRLTKNVEYCGKEYLENQYAILVMCDADINSVQKVFDELIPDGIVVDKAECKISSRLVSKECEGRRHNKSDSVYDKTIMFINNGYDVTEQILYSEAKYKHVEFNGGAGFLYKIDKVKFTEDIEINNIVIDKNMIGYILNSNNIELLKRYFENSNTHYIDYNDDLISKIEKINIKY